MEEIRIRQAKLYDVPAMSRIERDSFDSPWSAEEITKDVTAGGNVYVAVAEYGDEKAGYGEIRMIAGEAQIYNIAIAPEFRRAGIGEALLRHMIARAEEDGCVLVTLEVRSSNEAAMALYRKLGFREVGRRKGYYAKGGEDAVLMDLDLRRIEVEVEIEI
ncbi:MAG: ribosomal protein S18-alanine N-acetyltransferase [Mogibacterium sp.]|nr:ribosomal protein S18-alanine N-acetyltransferase [Mogibacterium sp.]